MRPSPYCPYVMLHVEDNPSFNLCDIGKLANHMNEYPNLRDNNPSFVEEKAMGDVCIPCYMREDGSVTLMSSEVGLEPLE